MVGIASETLVRIQLKVTLALLWW